MTPGPASSRPATRAPLGPGWDLWRDFAVRNAGFSVDGLEVFGPGDEAARLRALAGDARFREAMTWQNPLAVTNALGKLAADAPGSRRRRREETVASYWQRYCGKNDTIGFFGPLAWGRIDDDAPPLAARSGPVVRERAVHLEAWGVQALGEMLGIPLSTGCRTHEKLRRKLGGRAFPELDRLDAARDAVAAASPHELATALGELDRVFAEITGREPTRNHGRAYGARTLAFVDCTRDLDVVAGPGFVDLIAPVTRLIFEAGRWYSGRVQALVDEIVGRALPEGGHGPLGPVLGRVMPALFRLPPELDAEVAELQRRVGALLADPDPRTLGARATAAFADSQPAWHFGVFQSIDIQVAEGDGGLMPVVGDVHPCDNPLAQELFGLRFPGDVRARMAEDMGCGMTLMLPPLGPGMGVDARGMPMGGDVNIALAPESSRPMTGPPGSPGICRSRATTSSTPTGPCACPCVTSSACRPSSPACAPSTCSATRTAASASRSAAPCCDGSCGTHRRPRCPIARRRSVAGRATWACRAACSSSRRSSASRSTSTWRAPCSSASSPAR